MSLLRGIARPLLAAPLALDAIDALIHPDRHVAKLDALRPVFSRIEERSNIESIDPYLSRSARISAGVTLLAAGAFALGKAPRTCAAVLTAIALPMAVINHEQPASLRLKLANCAGLFFASLDRNGRPSHSWRRTQLIEAASSRGVHSSGAAQGARGALLDFAPLSARRCRSPGPNHRPHVGSTLLR